MKQTDDKKCTIDRILDPLDLARTYECASMLGCYNFDTSDYDDANCLRPEERCGKIM
jgi:hypothetical protein